MDAVVIECTVLVEKWETGTAHVDFEFSFISKSPYSSQKYLPASF